MDQNAWRELKMRILLLIALASRLMATSYYVANSGSDGNNGTTTSTPWQHISKVNAFAPGAVESGGLFVNNAETGNTSQFSSVTQAGSSTFTATGGSAIHGNDGFVPLSDGTNFTYGTKTITAAATVFARFYIYVPSAWTESANFNSSYILSLNSGATVRAHVYIQQQSAGVYQLHGQLNCCSFSNFGTSNLSVNAVHYVEIEFVSNASTGGIQFWVDGTSQGSIFNQNTGSQSIDTIQMGMISQNPFTNGASVALDDLKAATSGPIGIYSSGLGTSTGDTFFLNRGDAWTENLVPSCQGTDGTHMLSFDAFGSGAAPVINGTGAYGIDLNALSYVSVKNIEVTASANSGIRLSGGTTGDVVQNNYVHDTGGAGFLAEIVLNGTTSANVSSNFVYSKQTSTEATYGILITGSGSVATNSNTIASNTLTGLLAAGIRVDAQSGTAPQSNVIQGNDISHVSIGAAEAGIVFNGAGTGNSATQNFIYNNGTASRAAAAVIVSSSSPVSITFNLAQSNTGGCISITGAGAHTIYQNTCFNNNVQSGDSGELSLSSSAASDNVRDNLFWATPGKHILLATAGAVTGHTIDYNLFFGGQASPFGWAGTDYTYTAWQTAATQSAHGVNSNPLLADPQTSNFTLGSSSPALAAGVFIAAVSTANPPNIGAK